MQERNQVGLVQRRLRHYLRSHQWCLSLTTHERNHSHSRRAAVPPTSAGEGSPAREEVWWRWEVSCSVWAWDNPSAAGRPVQNLWTPLHVDRAQRKPRCRRTWYPMKWAPLNPNQRCCKFLESPPRDNILLWIAFLSLSQISVSSPNELLIFCF